MKFRKKPQDNGACGVTQIKGCGSLEEQDQEC